MKWIKCVIKHAANLTYDKIYEVQESHYSDWSGNTYGKIINDSGKLVEYDISNEYFFIDATPEVRQMKINQILNDGE